MSILGDKVSHRRGCIQHHIDKISMNREKGAGFSYPRKSTHRLLLSYLASMTSLINIHLIRVIGKPDM